MKEKVSLASLFLVFAKIGVLTFGGGMTMLPMLLSEVVERRNWSTEEEISDYFAIGQCTPGIIAVNTATFIGAKKRGIIGGIVATLGVVFPSVVIILILSNIILLFADNPLVQKAFMGIRVSVCILILNAVVKLGKSAFKGKATVITFLIVAAVSVFTSTSPMVIVPVVILAGVISCLFGFPKEANND